MRPAKKNVYIISGLAADEKIFRHIQFAGPDVTFLSWLEPLQHESLAHYASRMRASIKDPGPVLIGLSFGGIVAIEIAKQIPVEKIVLISSVKFRKELPLFFRISGKMSLHKLFPASKMKRFKRIVYWFFGISTKEEKALLDHYNAKASNYYLDWSVDKILNWENDALPCPVCHIHGSADRIFRMRCIKPDAVIAGGGHLMIFNRPDEVQEKINTCLSL